MDKTSRSFCSFLSVNNILCNLAEKDGKAVLEKLIAMLQRHFPELDMDYTRHEIESREALYPTMIEQILEGEKYYCFICRDIPIYEMLAAQTISIKDANGETLTGEYTLGAYVKKHADSDVGNLAKAMYAYAKSSYKYKISAEE